MKLIFFESSKDTWVNDCREQYQTKISHFIDFECQSIKSKNFGRENRREKLKLEEQKLTKAIGEKDFVIIFDENGKAYKDSIMEGHYSNDIKLSSVRRPFSSDITPISSAIFPK